MRCFVASCALVLLLITVGQIHASQILGPTVGMPPGGCDGVVTTSSPIGELGQTWIFFDFDPTVVSTLYLGLMDTPHAGLDGEWHWLSFDCIFGNTARWSGVTTWEDNPSVPIHLDITNLDSTGGTYWVTAESLGLDSCVGALLQAPSDDEISCNFQFTADLPGVENTPLGDVQGIDHPDTNFGFQGAFYYTLVPEPSALLLLVTGCVGLFLCSRRSMSFSTCK